MDLKTPLRCSDVFYLFEVDYIMPSLPCFYCAVYVVYSFAVWSYTKKYAGIQLQATPKLVYVLKHSGMG